MVTLKLGNGNAVLLGTQSLVALRDGRIELGDESRALCLELRDALLDGATPLLEVLGMMCFGMIDLGKCLGDLLSELIDLDLALEQLVLLDADVLLTLDLTFHITSDRGGGPVI